MSASLRPSFNPDSESKARIELSAHASLKLLFAIM